MNGFQLLHPYDACSLFFEKFIVRFTHLLACVVLFEYCFKRLISNDELCTHLLHKLTKITVY